jgi:hypothetical protein
MILFSFTIYIFKGKEKGNPKYHQLNGSRDFGSNLVSKILKQKFLEKDSAHTCVEQ